MSKRYLVVSDLHLCDVEDHAVTFGHSHQPRLIPLDDAVSFVDTGTWAPITQPLDGGALAPGYHNYLVVAPGGPHLALTFACWHRAA